MRALTATLALALATAPAFAETKIFVSLDSVVGLPFQAAVKASVLQAAKKEAAVSLVVEENAQDPAKHLRTLEAAIAAKAKAVIINVSDRETGRKAAALAAAAGMPLVFLNRRPTLDRVGNRVSIVSSNDLVAGRLQMRVVADKLGGKGEIMILRGPDGDTAAIERRTGMQEVLVGYPELNVVADTSANWSREEGRGLVAAWLKNGRRIDAIASANDEMALGAAEAIKAAGLSGRILVGGVDGGKEAVEAVKAGSLFCTVFHNGPAQGRQALANAMKLADGAYAQQYDWMPYELIVAGNVDLYAQR